jgi:fermentation-respiration switch protein FrsA (DUF1100 family)
VGIVRVVALAYLGVLIVLYALQTRLIFPGQDSQGQPYAVVRPAPGTELVHFTTAHGDSIAALYAPAQTRGGSSDPDAARRPTMLYFYGNAMCLSQAELELEQFRRLGLNVLIPEYVGYGMSQGSASEAGCRATADAAYDYLVTSGRATASRLVVAGWSLGAAVAIDLASRRPVAGLVALCTFTSAGDMARRLVPFLPISILLRHRFDNLRKIPRVGCPILIGHGRRDSMIPFSMATRLAAAATSPVTTLWIDEADHNDFFGVAGRRVDEAIAAFVRQVVPAEG